MKKFLLSIFALMLAVFSVQAQSDLIYTLTPVKGSNSDYTKNCDIKINGITWNLSGNSQTLPWRIGGKSITATDRALYSKTSMDAAVDRVVLTTGANTITVNSAKLLVADNEGFTNAVEYSFNLVANGSVEIPVTAKASSYYKFVFNVTNNTKSNKYILFSEAKFYGTSADGGGDTPDVPVLETLDTPVISPASCEFNIGESLNVTISAVEGAKIYYTLDGTTPTESSAVYSSALSIKETTTVKAIAVKEGFNNSNVATTTFTAIDPNATTATLSFANKAQRTEYTTSKQVWEQNGVKLTNDKGSSTTNVGDYAAPARFYKNSNIKIEATRNISKIEFYCAYDYVISIDGVTPSGTKVTVNVNPASTTYEVNNLSAQVRFDSLTVTYASGDSPEPVVTAPEIPATSDFVTSMNFEITNFNDYENGTTVYYSIDGGEPKVYTAAFKITTTSEIVAYAEKDGKKSDEVRAEYTRIAIDPAINILGDANADAFEGSVGVEIRTENGAVAYYTLNGEEPTIESTEYEGILTIKATATLKVIAVEEGKYRSQNVASKTFTMALKDTSVDTDATNVTFDASAQEYENGVAITSVTITEGITATFEKGDNSNSPKYYTTGTAIRCYGGNKFTITSTVGTITKIVLTYGSSDGDNEITTDCGEFSNDTWVGNAESVKFTVGGSKGNRRIVKITVTYGEAKNESYNLEVTSAVWATLFLDYAVEIPEGVTCYTVAEVNSEKVTLASVTDVLPANTGVIVKANAGQYEFKPTDNDAEVAKVDGLSGTTGNKYIFEDAYVLGIVDGVVGLYKAEKAGGVWLNNANKAYLPASALPADAQKSTSLRFDFDGTTAIEEVETEAAETVIYDLTGRRVNEITKAGVYIINGHKVLVK